MRFLHVVDPLRNLSGWDEQSLRLSSMEVVDLSDDFSSSL